MQGIQGGNPVPIEEGPGSDYCLTLMRAIFTCAPCDQAFLLDQFVKLCGGPA